MNKMQNPYKEIPHINPPASAFGVFIKSVKRICGFDLFKGLSLTLKEFISPPATIHYPAEVIPFSPRYRAVHSLQRLLESGNERCIGCGLCEKICTSNCIRIITHRGEDNRKKIDSYSINLGRCIFCGLCAEVCPELAIVMGQRFENASEARSQFATKKELLVSIDEAKTHRLAEFSGFGSVTQGADRRLRGTPVAFDFGVDSSLSSHCIDSSVDSSLSDSFAQSPSPDSLRRTSSAPHSQGAAMAQSNTANTKILDSNNANSSNIKSSDMDSNVESKSITQAKES